MTLATFTQKLIPNRIRCTFVHVLCAVFLLGSISGCSSMNSQFSSPLRGRTGATPATGQNIQVVPGAADFRTVLIGQQNTQTIQITNMDTAASQLTRFHVVGTGFSITAGATPATLAPGASQSVTVAFAPQGPGLSQGSLLISVGLNNPPT